MLREFWCETESVCERHGERQRQTNGDCCPVPLFGTGRYRTNYTSKTRSNATSKTPASKEKAGGRYKFKSELKFKSEAERKFKGNINGKGWRSEDRRHKCKDDAPFAAIFSHRQEWLCHERREPTIFRRTASLLLCCWRSRCLC
jgi:hypothetical protein